METYIFIGIVLPERAQLSFKKEQSLIHFGSDNSLIAKINILNNQVVVRVESDADWNIKTLRNVVKAVVQNELAIISYLKGYAYDVDIIRVLNQSREIDYVFGIEIPCIEERGKSIDPKEAMNTLSQKAADANGIFLHRCFRDLVSSMKDANDTAFYCYRAIESLRLHCAAKHGMSDAEKSDQWAKFREISGCDKETLLTIKNEADPLRHGGVSSATSEDRDKLFMDTWDVVDGYLKNI